MLGETVFIVGRAWLEGSSTNISRDWLPLGFHSTIKA
jgi:hypothetical protein